MNDLFSKIQRRLTVRYHESRINLYKYIDFYCSLIPGKLGWLLRRLTLASRTLMGNGVMIDELVSIRGAEKLELGSRTFIGRNTLIDANGGVTIGKDVLIGPDVKIWSADHNFHECKTTINRQGHIYSPVVIENDVWIGVSAIILKGVTIRSGAIVGAGSLVNKDVPENTIVAGNPAHPLRAR